jgi:hypothetical protein
MGHFADNMAQFIAVDFRHDEVKKHDVRIERGKQIQGRKPVLCRLDLMAFFFQQVARKF